MNQSKKWNFRFLATQIFNIIHFRTIIMRREWNNFILIIILWGVSLSDTYYIRVIRDWWVQEEILMLILRWKYSYTYKSYYLMEICSTHVKKTSIKFWWVQKVFNIFRKFILYIVLIFNKVGVIKNLKKKSKKSQVFSLKLNCYSWTQKMPELNESQGNCCSASYMLTDRI